MNEHPSKPDAQDQTTPSFSQQARLAMERRSSEITELDARVADLKKELKRLERLITTLEQLKEAATAGRDCEVVKTIDGSRDLMAAIDDFGLGDSRRLNDARLRHAESAEQAINGLSSSLPKELEELGHQVDDSSRFPKFTLHSGFFEIKVDRAKFEARIAVRHGPTRRVPADLVHIVASVTDEIRRCFGNPVDLETFVARLRSAYSALDEPGMAESRSLENVRSAFDDPVPPRDEFAVAMSVLLREGPGVASGISLDHTKDTTTGFLLPGYEDRGYFGSITIAQHKNKEQQ